MSDETLKSLGEKGFSEGEVGGNGLGFYGAKKSIMDWGGSIDVKSKIDSGSLIEIRLLKSTI
jgi:sensor histidine kinase regulating citrate/malate metabolism